MLPARRTLSQSNARAPSVVGPQWFAVRVTASAVRVARKGPGILRDRPDGESDTTLHFEGELDRPVIRMRAASIMVVSGDAAGNPGAAIGGSTIWHVVRRLW